MTRPSSAALQMIERLVAFDTTSRNSNLALIEWIRGYLADHGIAAELFFDDDGRKANLFATIGPADRGGVMLSGHTDVVPIDGQEWSTDAFRVTEKDGRLYGRGTTDMKSFVAVALAMVPRFAAARLATPVHLAFSYDEEVGCLGVRRMIDAVAARPIRPTACIVGEPTGMQVVVAHKGKLSYRCDVRGFECHSSICHTGVNAVEAAAEVVVRLKRIGRRLREEGPHDPAFDPPYTTVHTGVVAGGTALNIVPKDCFVEFEFRHLPGADPRALLAEVRDYAETVLLPEMRAVRADTGFTWTEMSSFPGLGTPEDAPVVELARALSGANRTGKVAFGTEAGLFEAAGIPTVVCGPGSIDQAHKPDEFVALDQVAACEAFLGRLIERLGA
ncbi:MAG: acetylornithine deacetylase [Alphaproteobacteria bacterium]|nr:acetylornithine deacetylase [Alphaproteobacteria bacterium]